MVMIATVDDPDVGRLPTVIKLPDHSYNAAVLRRSVERVGVELRNHEKVPARRLSSTGGA